MLKLHWGQVDRDSERANPGRRLPTRLPQNPFADLNDDAAAFGNGDECAGRNGTVRGMLPPRQRFESDDLTVDRRLRLIV